MIKTLRGLKNSIENVNYTLTNNEFDLLTDVLKELYFVWMRDFKGNNFTTYQLDSYAQELQQEYLEKRFKRGLDFRKNEFDLANDKLKLEYVKSKDYIDWHMFKWCSSELKLEHVVKRINKGILLQDLIFKWLPLELKEQYFIKNEQELFLMKYQKIWRVSIYKAYLRNKRIDEILTD